MVFTNYSFFLIGGTTPAIKPTFRNNTQFEIKEIGIDIDFLDKGGILTYKANITVKSGENGTHSGWGLAVGVDKIRLGIISYTTTDGKVYRIENNEIFWNDLEVDFSTISNNANFNHSNGYETIVIDNLNKDNALKAIWIC